MIRKCAARSCNFDDDDEGSVQVVVTSREEGRLLQGVAWICQPCADMPVPLDVDAMNGRDVAELPWVYQDVSEYLRHPLNSETPKT